MSRVRWWLAAVFVITMASLWHANREETIQPFELPAGSGEDGKPMYWFKGNTHAHARIKLEGWSHGNAEPGEVARWYADHGYHFLAITDHNRYNPGDAGESGATSRQDFILLPGMEITSDHRFPGVNEEHSRMVHSTALGIEHAVDWTFDDPAVDAIIRQHVERTTDAGGLAILNHPNYRFQVTAEDILAVPDLHLVEFYNAHPRSNHEGHPGFRLGSESLWDEVLSAGKPVWNVAADDAHDFGWYGRLMRRFGSAPPGGAWVMVRAADLTPDSVVEALRTGDFYASTGVLLDDISVDGEQVHVSVNRDGTEQSIHSSWVRKAAPIVDSDDSHQVIEVIGAHGKLLHWTHDQHELTYRLPPGEPYMRIRVTYLDKLKSVTGADRARAFYAWTQPVFAGTGSAE